MVGSDPGAYVQDSDKWTSVIQYSLIIYFFPYLPYVLLIAPWIYFLIKRNKHKKDSQSFLKKIILISIGGLITGFMLPYLILAILASLAAYSMYGGTI